MKITDRQLRNLIREIMDVSLSEGEPSGAVQLTDRVKADILATIKATRHGIDPPGGNNSLKFTIRTADPVMIDSLESTEFSPKLRGDDRTIPSGYDDELDRNLEGMFKRKRYLRSGGDLDPEQYPLPHSVRYDYTGAD